MAAAGSDSDSDSAIGSGSDYDSADAAGDSADDSAEEATAGHEEGAVAASLLSQVLASAKNRQGPR
jgi:hypothetical protein